MTIAELLERAASDVARRAGARGTTLDGADRLRARLTACWRSPEAAALDADVAGLLRSARTADPQVTDAIRAMQALAGEARRVAQVLEEVEWREKSWNQQLVANWSEWQDRTTTAVAAHLPGGSDQATGELTRRYQEETRLTEEASARRHDALMRWHRMGAAVAGSLGAAAEALGRIADASPPPSFDPDRTPAPGAPTDARLRLVLGDLRSLLAEPGPVALARLQALLATLSPAEIELVVAQLSDGELDAWLAASPPDQRRLHGILGRLAAGETRRALAAAGIDPNRFRPDHLKTLDPGSPGYQQLIDTLDRNRRRLTDADHATAYVVALGVEGTRALIGTLEMLQLHPRLGFEPLPAGPEDRVEGITRDVVGGFARATRSPATAGLRRSILTPGTPWQHHQLALLLSAPGADYDPAFVSAAADVLLIDQRDAGRTYPLGNPLDGEYPPLNTNVPLWPEDWRNLADAIALKALAENPAAAARWVHDDNGPRAAQLAFLVHHPPGNALAAGLNQQVNVDPDRIRQLGQHMEGSANEILANVLQQAEPAGVLTHAQAAQLYAHIVHDVAGTPLVTDGVKRILADALLIYLPDIGNEASSQFAGTRSFRESELDTVPFTRPDLVKFFAALAADPDAAGQIGQSITLWAADRTAGWADASVPYAVNEGQLVQVVMIMGVVEDGLDRAGETHQETYENYAWGADKAVQLLVDDILSSVPVVGAPASAVAKPIGERISEAVGDQIEAHSENFAPPTSGAFEHKVQTLLKQHLAHRLTGQPVDEKEVDHTIRERLGQNNFFLTVLDLAPQSNVVRYGESDHWNRQSETTG